MTLGKNKHKSIKEYRFEYPIKFYLQTKHNTQNFTNIRFLAFAQDQEKMKFYMGFYGLLDFLV